MFEQSSNFLTPPVTHQTLQGHFFILPPKATLSCTLPTCQAATRFFDLLEDVLPEQWDKQLLKGPNYSLSIGTGTPPPFAGKGEAYTLDVSSTGIHLIAATAEGLYRASATLRQLLCQARVSNKLPTQTIFDEPALRVRGLMLDVSRGRIYSLETLFEIIRFMAQLKMNRLELYFEAAFAYPDYPAIWQNASPYTANDLQILDRYCIEHFIQFVPNQNTLGHFERWFKRDPTLLCHAELPEGGAPTPWGSIQTCPTGLCTSAPETRQFINSLLQTLLPNFTSQEVNLGGDEVFDLGLGRSAGKGEKAELFIQYLTDIATIAAQYGKSHPTFWADMLPRFPERLPEIQRKLPTATWTVWGYEAGWPFQTQVENLAKNGMNYLVAPGTSSWRSFCGRHDNMLQNVREAVAAACYSDYGRGILLTDWGDAGHLQPLVVSLPALVFAASLAWNPSCEPDLESAIDILTHVSGLAKPLIELANTYHLTGVETGNSTQLFKQFFLPQQTPSPFADAALQATAEKLKAIAEAIQLLKATLWTQELQLACQLQQLAVLRAQGVSNLKRPSARVAALLTLQWNARGPKADREESIASLLNACR